MIRAFLFDIGNVIVRFDFSKAMRELAAWCEVSSVEEALGRIEGVKLRYESGQMPRWEFLQRVFELLEFRGTEAQFIAAWQGIFTANEPMHALIRTLHGRYPLYLLSNTNDMHMEGLVRDFAVFGCFCGGTFSHEVGASKPAAAIYRSACQRHGLVPGETFFIDDLAVNIQAAQRLGFVTHHYDAASHEALLSALAVAGVHLN